MGELAGQVAVITGGGRGQGRSHAVTLAREGADIVICDIRAQLPSVAYQMNSSGDMDETVRLVEAEGRRCLAIEADVRDSDQMDGVIAGAVERFGRVDILSANAGIWTRAKLVETTNEMWQDSCDTNLSGVFYVMRAAARQMMEQGSGRIVATSSICGRQGTEDNTAYNATKWAVIGLVKTAAIELGRHNINVNAVCPTAIDTPMLDYPDFWRALRPDLEEPTRADIEPAIAGTHRLPVGTVPAQAVSDAVLYLVRESGRYLNGVALDVAAGKSTEWSA